MDVDSHASNQYGSLNSSNAEFTSDAYLEYRQRVLAQLAAECDDSNSAPHEEPHFKQISQSVQHSLDASSENDMLLLHSSHCEDKIIPHQSRTVSSKKLSDRAGNQPSWDDTDLVTSYNSLPSSNIESWKHQSSDDEHFSSLRSDVHESKSENSLYTQNTQVHPITWSSFDQQIEKAKQANIHQNRFTHTSNDQLQDLPSPLNTKKMKLNSLKRQRHEREKTPQKCSSFGDDGIGDQYDSHKPWYPARIERSYSASSHSLQICYINESCSSDEATCGGESAPTSPPAPRNGPLSPPSLSCGYGKQYMRQKRFSDASSASSTSSAGGQDNHAIVTHCNYNPDLRSGKTHEMEMEARYQLAQAHKKAKLLAEEERRKKMESEPSITLKLLEVTLPELTNAKRKSFSLSREDCYALRKNQLQLILNDMQSRKQTLNHELMSLLLQRDELKTENDAKAVDIEDMKEMLAVVGPETTV